MELWSKEEKLILKFSCQQGLLKKVWAGLSFSKRAYHLKKIEHFIAKNSDEIARVISEATSKTKEDALTTEVISSLLACQWYAKNAEKFLKPKKS